MSGDGGEFVPPAGDKVGVRLGTGIRYYRYLPPKGNVAGFDFATGRAGGLVYAPPAGSQIGLDFSAEYTPPAGNKVGLEFLQFAGGGTGPAEDAYLFPAGFDSYSHGSQTVRHQYRAITTAGFDVFSAGQDHKAFNSDQHITGRGFDSQAFGPNAIIINRNRYILHGGSDFFQANTKHQIWLWERHIKLEGRGMLSMKHAAVAAGLGQLGKNTLLGQ